MKSFKIEFAYIWKGLPKFKIRMDKGEGYSDLDPYAYSAEDAKDLVDRIIAGEKEYILISNGLNKDTIKEKLFQLLLDAKPDSAWNSTQELNRWWLERAKLIAVYRELEVINSKAEQVISLS